jgi:hypothetical protein
MFSVDNPDYMILVGMMSKKSYIHQYPRSALDEMVTRYNIANPKQFKTKKALALFLLRLWSEAFQKDRDLYKGYQERYGEFSLDRDTQEEKDEETQIAEYQELCKRMVE